MKLQLPDGVVASDRGAAIPDNLQPALLPVAKRVFWWGKPEEWMQDASRFTAQVMVFADWNDTIPRALDLLRAGMDPAGWPAILPIGRHGPQSLRWRMQEDAILRADLDAARSGVCDLERGCGGLSAPRRQGNRGDERLATDVETILHNYSFAALQTCFSMLPICSR